MKVTRIVSPGQVTTPLDPYLLTAQDAYGLVAAQSRATAKCMKDFGVDFAPAVPALDTFVAGAATYVTRNGAYGIFDPARVSAVGYSSPIAVAVTPPPAGALAQQAYTGSIDKIGGRTVPDGGCRAVGAAVTNSVGIGFSPQLLPGGGPESVTADAPVQAVFRQWSTCMKNRGYTYTDPVAPLADPNVNVPGAPTAASLAMAAADTDCKIQTNVVGVVTAYQNVEDEKYVNSHLSQLRAYRAKIQQIISSN